MWLHPGRVSLLVLSLAPAAERSGSTGSGTFPPTTNRSNQPVPPQLQEPRFIGTLPFLPHGFYTDVFDDNAGVDADYIGQFRLGFTTAMPYINTPHGKDNKTWAVLESWLDRCDRVGIIDKLVYDLSHYVGYGNDNSTPPYDIISDEVHRASKHSSVFAYMLADEPDWKRKDPAIIRATNMVVKKVDTTRPTVVCLGTVPFYQHSCDQPDNEGRINCILWSAYLQTADVIVPDPYPLNKYNIAGRKTDSGIVPNISTATEVVQLLTSHLKPTQSVWVAIQAFGGGEEYPREPSPGELRVMTYLSWIAGSTGTLYFQHTDAAYQLRLPASPVLYSETIRLAAEANELGPSIAAKATGPPVSVTATAMGDSARAEGCIRTRSFTERSGSVLIIVASTRNVPVLARFEISSLGSVAVSSGVNRGGTYCDDNISGADTAGALLVQIEVLFEHRNVSLHNESVFSDFVPALGTRAYRIHTVPKDGKMKISASNLVANPSFESQEGGGLVPDGLWSVTGQDLMAAYFADPYTSVHGTHSLRVHTPTARAGLQLLFFPMKTVANITYVLSVWTKASGVGSGPLPRLQLGFGSNGHGNITWSASAVPPGPQIVAEGTVEWTEHKVNVNPGYVHYGATLAMQTVGEGVVWLDLLQLATAD